MIVKKCHNCQSFVYYTNTCGKCKNAFFCDESCMRADAHDISMNCAAKLPKTPRLMEPLIVEIHSGTDMGMSVHLFYEHARRFSLKMRGMQLFEQLREHCSGMKWFATNQYFIELDTESK